MAPSGGWAMSRVRDVFAQNLRARLAGRGAVARLTAATGISPVQVNRYLKGTIPNERNLSLIADYLTIEEHELFTVGPPIERRLSDFFAATRRAVQDELTETCGAPTEVHSVYYRIPDVKGAVVRSIMIVRNEGGLRSFTRYTKLKRGPVKESVDPVNRHAGIVKRTDGRDYYIAFNESAPHEPSLLAIELAGWNRGLAGGVSIVGTSTGPRALAIVMQEENFFPDERTIFERAGVVPVSELTHGAEIEILLRNPRSLELSLASKLDDLSRDQVVHGMQD